MSVMRLKFITADWGEKRIVLVSQEDIDAMLSSLDPDDWENQRLIGFLKAVSEEMNKDNNILTNN